MKKLVKAFFILVFIGTVVYLATHQKIPCRELQGFLSEAGLLGELFFVGLSALAGLFLVPKTFWVVVASISYSSSKGLTLTFLASMLSSVGAYLISAHLARARVHRYFSKKPWFIKLENQFERSGFSLIFATRLSHFPFGAINYAAGVLPVSFRAFFLATLIGIIPGTLGIFYGAQGLGCRVLEGDTHHLLEMNTKLLVGGTVLAVLSLIPWILQFRSSQKPTNPAKPRQ